MIYANIILALLSLASKLFDWFQQQKWIAEGEQRAIAVAMVEIMRKSKYGKAALEEAHNLSDAALDKRLRDLEPEPEDSK